MNFTILAKDRSAFTLVNGSTEIATIKYTAQSQSVRLQSNERRVFFLEEVGVLQSKILLKTEYGVQIGENYYTKQQHKGVLYLSKQKFSYSIDADAINMYHKRQQLIFQLDKANALDAQDVSALLFSLAWMLTNAEISATAAHTASGQYVS
jgi:hypothetical protein